MLLHYSILYPVSIWKAHELETHLWKSVLFLGGLKLKKLYLAQRLHCNSLDAYGGLRWGAATFALQISFHYNQSSQMFQIAKWDLSHCDQCYLSKDTSGMNIVADEHLVTSELRVCWIVFWMLEKRRLKSFNSSKSLHTPFIIYPKYIL